MKLQLIRNATLKLTVAGQVILVDPFLAPRHSRPSYTGRSENPLVDLPMPIEEILKDVDLVVVSHLHSDHFDPLAKEIVPKHLPILCQPGDETAIREAGFENVTVLEDTYRRHGLVFRRCEGSHGLGPVVDKMGRVMGFLLVAFGEPTLYWSGDTVLYPSVIGTILRHRPDIIVTHSCGALWDGDLIVMDAPETIVVCDLAPWATVVATHMEALDHATVSRADLRTAAAEAYISVDRLRIPADGEALTFRRPPLGKTGRAPIPPELAPGLQ